MTGILQREMKPHGTYRLLGSPRPRGGDSVAPFLSGALRTQRIIDSLRHEISHNEQVRGVTIRQVFSSPREIFRIELEVPEMKYQRTTLIDRDALEELLEVEEIRALVRDPID